jgi:hypothetical protein
MGIQQEVSPFITYAFLLLTSSDSSPIPFQFYVLSDDASSPTFNAISHE